MSSEGKRLRRSPPYPFVPLGKAVDRAKQVHEKALHHAVGMSVLAEAWGYGLKSSGLVQTAAALIQFGLLADEGASDKRKFQLTKEAIRIVQDADPSSEKRKELLKRAALMPKIHQEIWARFTTASMSESVVKNYLMFDRADANESPFSAEAASAVLGEYKSSISFANIDSEGIPAGLMASQTENSETNQVEPPSEAEHIEPTHLTRTRSAPKVGMKEDVFSLKEGDVVLQWPGQISAESYQDLEDWAAIILRKIKRGIGAKTEDTSEG
jgi:hypothetical protein